MGPNKYGMRMFEEDDGGENITGGSGEGETQTEIKPSTVQLDPSVFDKFGEVIAKQFKQQDDSRQKEQAPRPPTPEERAAARKQFGMFDADDAFVQKFGNIETQKQAIQEMVDRIYESQGNITAAMLAKQDQAWQDRFQPVHQMLTKREEDERVSRFHSRYPQLADPEMQAAISGVGQQLAKQGAFNGLPEAKAFEVLAKGVESLAKKYNPQFTLTAKTDSKSSNELAVEPSGARGGGGQAGSGVKSDSPNGLFGPVKSSKR